MQALHTLDELPLHLRQWSVRGAGHGTVLLVHGLGEHIGRYEHLAERLNAAGWHVAGYDQRGHGASAGARGAIAQPDSLLSDLACVIDALRSEPPQPLVLLGHSMGGLVVARFVAEGLAAEAGSVVAGGRCVGVVVPRARPGHERRAARVAGPARAAGAAAGGEQRPEAGMDLTRPGDREGLRRRSAGARSHHAAAGAFHRRRRSSGAGRGAALAACPRCCCGPAPTVASIRTAAPPSRPPHRRQSCTTGGTRLWRTRSSMNPSAKRSWATWCAGCRRVGHRCSRNKSRCWSER